MKAHPGQKKVEGGMDLTQDQIERIAAAVARVMASGTDPGTVATPADPTPGRSGFEPRPLAKEIGTLIKRSRRGQDLAREQLARRIDRSMESIAMWEQGRTIPSVPALLRLADGLGVRVEKLLPADYSIARREPKRQQGPRGGR